MESIKNGIAFEQLAADKKEEFLEQYGNYPLKDYVDWKSYYDSDDGNVMNFVRCIGEYKDNKGDRILVLDRFSEDDNDYLLVYNCNDNSFYKTPDTLETDYVLVDENGDEV